MSNPIYIEKLELKNFRCYNVPGIGPFRKFNIIFGRNGSGKTSLIEALEIALSGRSSRIKEGEAIEEVVANQKGLPVKIGVFNNKGLLSIFDSSKQRFESSKVINNLFNIQTNGQRARVLLPSLLETHNMLYSERIIQFLEAEKKEKLYSVLNESIAGRETMEQWSRIEIARSSISRFLKGFDRDSDSIDLKVKEIQDLLLKANQMEVSDLEEKWSQIINYFLPLKAIIQQFACDKNYIDDLEDITRLYTQVRDIKNTCDEIKAKTTAEEELKNNSLHGIKEKQHSIKVDFSEIQKQILEQDQIINEHQDKLLNSNGCISKIELEKESKQNKVEKLNNLEKEIKSVMDWFPEFMAEQKSKELEKEASHLQEKILRLEYAVKQIDLLPSIEEVNTITTQYKLLTQTLSPLMIEVEELNRNYVEKQQGLQLIEERLQKHRSKDENIKKVLLEFYGKLDEYLRLNSTKSCPSCGSVFNSPIDLIHAIEATKLAITASKEPSELEIEIENKLNYQQEIFALTEKVKNLYSEIDKVNIQIKSSIDHTTSYEKGIAEYEVALKSAGFEIPQNKDISLSERLKTVLNIPIKDIFVEVELKSRNLSNVICDIWKDLRRNEYMTLNHNIEESIKMIQNFCNELKFEPPIGDPYSTLLGLIKLTQEVKSQTREDIFQLEKQIEKSKLDSAQLIQFINVKKQEMEKNERSLKEKNIGIEKLSMLAIKYQRIVELGLLKENEILDPEYISENLTSFLTALDMYKEKVKLLAENDKLKKRFEDELREFSIQKASITKKREKAKAFLNRLENLQSPQDYTAQVLKRHEKVISMFFKNLHWPRDFKDVQIELENNFEIFVTNMPTSERYPAHYRLSAGQRAALAISLFWTFNTSFKNIPDLLIMDEPVQNIDELNILNFLDGLRWFIETTGHQVFLTTASERIGAIIRKKFAYLKDDFLEINLKREYGSTIVKYVGWDDNEICEEVLG